jgi:hypothetical protein
MPVKPEEVKSSGTRTSIISANRRARDSPTAPPISLFGEFPKAGGLMAYGPNVGELYRRCGDYVAKIVHDAKPSELPIQRPERFDLVINLKTAEGLGISTAVKDQHSRPPIPISSVHYLHRPSRGPFYGTLTSCSPVSTASSRTVLSTRVLVLARWQPKRRSRCVTYIGGKSAPFWRWFFRAITMTIQCAPVPGPFPNIDPGLAGETGVSRKGATMEGLA